MRLLKETSKKIEEVKFSLVLQTNKLSISDNKQDTNTDIQVFQQLGNIIYYNLSLVECELDFTAKVYFEEKHGKSIIVLQRYFGYTTC